MSDDEEDPSRVTDPDRYSIPAYRKFVVDCLAVDLETYHYHGRGYYEGPAVNVDYADELPDTVPCRRDSMGLGFVFYPTGAMTRNYDCRRCGLTADNRREAKECCGVGALAAQ